MKKILLLLIIFGLMDHTTFCLAEQQDGIIKKYYPNGKLEAEETYKEGKQEGISKYYFESGGLRAEVNFKNGKENGITRHYNGEGKLTSAWNYENGDLKGRREYYENGALEAEIDFEGESKFFSGIQKLYYENGMLKAEIPHKNGYLIGVRREYYPTGRLWKEETFQYNEDHEYSELVHIKEYDETGGIVTDKDVQIPSILR